MSITETFIEQTFESWLEEFKPITNHLDPNASFQDESGKGIMFETYGDEVEFVKKQDPRCIWTYGDGDDGGGYIWNGWHFVNRLGYFITEIPCPENTTIQIQVDESPIECDTCGVFIYNEEDDHECEE
jgi:hypothetical protein